MVHMHGQSPRPLPLPRLIHCIASAFFVGLSSFSCISARAELQYPWFKTCRPFAFLSRLPQLPLTIITIINSLQSNPIPTPQYFIHGYCSKSSYTVAPPKKKKKNQAKQQTNKLKQLQLLCNKHCSSVTGASVISTVVVVLDFQQTLR